MATTVENPFDTQQPKVAPVQTDASGLTKATYTNWTVDPSQTVEARTAGIIASNSPLMQLAESRANQQMNSRGLINSSMAVGAGQTAVMDAATNIAKQDASTAATAAQFNTSESNKNSLYNAGAKNDWEQSLKTSNDSAVADMYKKYMDALYSIDSNKDLDAGAKVKMKQAQFNSLTAFAKIRGLKLDLDFNSISGVTPEAQAEATTSKVGQTRINPETGANERYVEATSATPNKVFGGLTPAKPAGWVAFDQAAKPSNPFLRDNNPDDRR